VRAPNLRIAAFLAVLAALAFAANLYYWTVEHRIAPVLVLAALVLAGLLAILPWTARPSGPQAPSPSACHKCGAEPSRGERAAFCLGCGAFPRARGPAPPST
jgi:hypothetical protein